MSIHFLPGKLEGEERKEVIQAVPKQLQEAVIEAIRPLLTEFCAEEQTAKLGREKRSPRRVSEQAHEIDWQCGHCGCRDAHHFTRDGHYRRSLETGWGYIDGLQVPMLECQRCGHDVICTSTILEKYQRFWLDLDQRVLFGSGLCQSLRHSSQEWSALIGKSRMGRAKPRGSQMSHRLWERGLRPEKGLQAVIRDGCGELGEAITWVYGTTVLEQRCIFHKLPSAG